MERCHGEGYDWRNAPIDGAAMDATGGRKAHGRWDHYYFYSLFLMFCSNILYIF
jgi:hypothetical protein